jgi:2-polyprenyl-3-methyl-5-hydroxy-6-metoxy-1,4-benzoquinol methylase
MKKQSQNWNGLVLIGILFIFLATSAGQDMPDDEKIWESFKAWILTNPLQPSLKAYGEKLKADGLSEEEIQKQLDTIRRLYKEHPEKDGFTSIPSVFMIESTEGLEPGTALDVGAGQGRNAVWIAQRGWDVTAIDISGVGLAAATANAEKAGTSITTVKTTYQDFDFGTERWDLIVMILSWAPVSDTTFVARLHASLCPGGVVVFEHVLETEKQSFPAYVHGLAPNTLLSHFKDFHIQKYEEGIWPGDWGGPPAELVRMIARKK